MPITYVQADRVQACVSCSAENADAVRSTIETRLQERASILAGVLQVYRYDRALNVEIDKSRALIAVRLNDSSNSSSDQAILSKVLNDILSSSPSVQIEHGPVTFPMRKAVGSYEPLAASNYSVVVDPPPWFN